MEFNLLDELDAMMDNKPRYTEQPMGTVVAVDDVQYYEVSIYRGSGTTNTDGVSWWTTQYSTACVYAGAYGDKAIVMQRTIKLPVYKGSICNPSPYLLGGKGGIVDGDVIDMADYSYGISMDTLDVNNLPHFDISISDIMLESISTWVGVDKPVFEDVPGRTIKISLE
jgi:hypothetical protein